MFSRKLTHILRENVLYKLLINLNLFEKYNSKASGPVNIQSDGKNNQVHAFSGKVVHIEVINNTYDLYVLFIISVVVHANEGLLIALGLKKVYSEEASLNIILTFNTHLSPQCRSTKESFDQYEFQKSRYHAVADH